MPLHDIFLKKAYTLYFSLKDKDSNGLVDCNEIKNILLTQLTAEEVKEIMFICDEDQDNKIKWVNKFFKWNLYF